MDSVKIIHCADLHIGASESFLEEKAAGRRLEALFTFEKIIETAKTENADIILIAGDLLDSNKIEARFIDRIITLIASIPDTKVIYSAGNHDPKNNEFPFAKTSLPNNFFIMPTKDSYVEFSDLRVRVYGKSFAEVYQKGEESFSLKSDSEFINLMCIHGELRADLGSAYNSITDNFIKSSNMDYIALGHTHKRSEIACLGGTYYAYCGCAEGQGFDELGEKGIYIGEISKGSNTLTFKRICKRLHIAENFEIKGNFDSSYIAQEILGFLEQKYGDSFEDNLYKIALTGGIDKDMSLNLGEIKARLSERLYFVKLRDKTEIAEDLKQISGENSLKGIFVKKMLEKIENSTEDKEKYIYALKIGLKAFNTEAQLYEDR